MILPDRSGNFQLEYFPTFLDFLDWTSYCKWAIFLQFGVFSCILFYFLIKKCIITSSIDILSIQNLIGFFITPPAELSFKMFRF
jgi:hypothetical protein